MAEILGVVSAAIGFGTVIVQFTDSLLVLKDCVDQVRDAPDDLKRLLQSIEIAGYVLADIEEDLAQDDATAVSVLQRNKHAQKSLQLCIQATKTLDDISKELVRDIQPSGPGRLRRHYAAVKVVLQRSKVEKYMAVLQNALQLLQLSQQCYLRAMMRVQPELIVQKMAQTAKSITDEDPPPYAEASSQITKRTTGEMQQRRVEPTSKWSYLWRLNMPTWVTSKALEITARRFPGGWDWQLRAYRAVPWESEVIQSTAHGDIANLQRLFASGQATPFDQLEGPCTRGLLGYTFGGANGKETFEFLVSQGADVHSSGNNIEDTLGYLVWSGSMSGLTSPLLPSFRAFLCHMPDVIYDTEEEVLEGVLNEFHGTAEEFAFFQRELCPSFYSMSQGTRTAVAIEATSGHWDACHLPETIRAILGPGPLRAEDLQLEKQLVHVGYRDRTTLVQCVSRKVGQNLAMIQREEYLSGFHRKTFVEEYPPGPARSRYTSWDGLFKEFMGIGADIHQVVDGRTPFLTFLVGYLKWVEEPKYCVMSWKTGFRVWLKDLQAAGVDLQQFGAKEKRIWEKLPDRVREYLSQEFQYYYYELWLRPLIGFSYGPSPDDWDIWVSEKSDYYAGEFWEMIEMEPEVMPGAWPVE
ncbi:hypothetical protein P168DRAFT_305556 [Aspergillus campestris IBT 28561]|uniref:NACHT-NTPase and P-loop NTPases N-terminal domain-containing protein n=1 Tax=Aspergillus campestris (strain IBT 28561) TaxID=1392248 RepID=A0A2I1D042_ASPC2|nr:uncharacterized protein P168DRAFT_305556 [Aspergillus campestris IBT 28561]PKY03247.1 hypothetical protein P168DRAFT_305556 [Aspergillus campestris IBT 28561]